MVFILWNWGELNPRPNKSERIFLRVYHELILSMLRTTRANKQHALPLFCGYVLRAKNIIYPDGYDTTDALSEVKRCDASRAVKRMLEQRPYRSKDSLL